MVGGPNGTISGEEMIFSFVTRKVVHVSGKKIKHVTLQPRNFRVTASVAGTKSDDRQRTKQV